MINYNILLRKSRGHNNFLVLNESQSWPIVLRRSHVLRLVTTRVPICQRNLKWCNRQPRTTLNVSDLYHNLEMAIQGLVMWLFCPNNPYPPKIKQASIIIYSNLRRICLTVKTLISKGFKNLLRRVFYRRKK